MSYHEKLFIWRGENLKCWNQLLTRQYIYWNVYVGDKHITTSYMPLDISCSLYGM